MADFTDDQLLEIIEGGRSDRVEFEESLSGTAPVAKKRPYGYIPFDIHPIPGSSIADLDLNLFEQYLPQLYSKDKLNSDNRSIKDKLVATKMIFATDNPLATVLGILVIGKCPQDYMSNAYIKFRKIDGCNESDEIVDETNIQGTILDMLNHIDEKLRAYNCRPGTSPEPREKQKGIYPLAALQEIVHNAVMHREYENTKEPVKVRWFNDRVEIFNPGGPYGIINSKNFGKASLTDYRNPHLARTMGAMGFVKHYGFGIPVSSKMLKEAGHPELKYTVNQHKVKVTIKPAKSSS